MHQVCGACVQVYEFHRSRCLCLILLTTAATFVKDLEKIPKASKDKHFKIWVYGHDEHCLCELRADLFVPVLIKVRILVVKRKQCQRIRRVLQLSISHQQNDARVHKGGPENGEHDKAHLLRDCWVAN